MPEYDAYCAVCGKARTIRKGMQDPWPDERCCNQVVRRRYTAPAGIIYLGEGFNVSESRDEIEQFRYRHLW